MSIQLARDTYKGISMRPIRGRAPVAPVAREEIDPKASWAMTRAVQLVRATSMSANRAAGIAADEAEARFGRDVTRPEHRGELDY